MGVNDELTPGEHTELRSRLLAGTKAIKPAGRHRTAWIATTVAVVLVAGLSATAIGASSLLRSAEPAPIATNSPTPAPSPAQTNALTPSASPESAPSTPPPTVAFAGDCDRALTLGEVEAALGAPAEEWDSSAHFGTRTDATAALLGGMMCSWHADNFQFAALSVLDAAAVSSRIKDDYASVRCGGMSVTCSMGVVHSDVWIGVSLTSNLEDPYAEMTDEQAASQQARLQALIDIVESRVVPGMAVATPRESSWWTLEPCQTRSATVEEALGESLTMGFPGDSIPHGMDWEILVESGMDDWCSWHANMEESSTIVEMYPQPGAGEPSEAALSDAFVQPVGVVGADRAWMWVDPQHPSTSYLVATSGTNRLTVRLSSDDPARITDLAAAILAQLG